MPKFLFGLAASLVVASATLVSNNAYAADVSISKAERHRLTTYGYCQDIERCGPDGCNVYHVCTRACPDGESCAPLYGAYGPYGGLKYWGAYTDSGWDYSR